MVNTFLNAYILELDSSLGFGSNSSSCQIRLIEDPEEGYNFTPPETGSACIITAGEFEFGGILQRKNYEQSTSGFIWDVVLEGPSKILDGVAVVLDDFQGTEYIPGTSTSLGSSTFDLTNQVTNVWNPFAVRENFSYGGIFGGSNVNSFGFPASDLLGLLEEISRGEHEFGGKIEFGENQYTLDLTDLRNIVSENYRIKGPVQSLASIIQDVCDTLVVDYTFVIEGTTNSLGVITSDAKIKIKIIDKNKQAELGIVNQKIDDLKTEGKWISSSSGQELSNSVTKKIAIGGPATRYWRASLGQGQIFPIWGKLRNGQYLTSAMPTLENIDELQIPVVLEDGSRYEATPLEIWAAMAGRDAWDAYKIMKGETGIASRSAISQSIIDSIDKAEASPIDLYNTQVRRTELDAAYLGAERENERIQKIFNAVANVGNEFWGTKFFVLIPVESGGITNNLKFLQEDKDYISSWEIAGSAWVEDKPFTDIAFYDSEGKLKPTATYQIADTRTTDYSALGSDYGVGFGGLSTHSVNIEDEIYWRQDLNGNITAMVAVSVPQVSYYPEETRKDDGIFQLAKIIFGVDPDSEGAYFAKSAGYEGLKFTLPPIPIAPLEIGIPQVSTRYTYGPWYNSFSDKGKTEVIVDENLRPEVFGSTAGMNQAANSLAYVGSVDLGSIENGVINTVGLPEYNIAERFTSSGPYITSISINFSTSGFTTEYVFNTYTPERGKLAKYNFDRIANINRNNIRFAQEIRDLYQLPALPKPEIRRAINRDIREPLYNGFSVFMQTFNPFTNEVSSSLVDPATASGSIHDKDNQYISEIGNDKAPVEIRKDGIEGEDDEAPLANKAVPQSDQDTGLFSGGNVGPTSKELNPFFTHDENHNGVGLADDPEDINLKKQKPVSKVKTVADRYPRWMAGWGFDLDGLPVPNSTPDEPGSKFASNAGTDRTKWKNGPLLWAWDEDRQGWSGSRQIVEGLLSAAITAPTSPLSPTSDGRMVIYRGQGWNVSEAEEIVLTNRDTSLSVDYSEGDEIYIMAMRINREWRVVYVGCVD